MTIDHKATGTCSHGTELNGGAAGLAKHHIAAARIGAGRGPRVTLGRTHNQVSQAVTVDIANPRDAHTALVARTLAIDDKAAGARSHGREVDGRGTGLAKHHVAAPTVGSAGRIAQLGANDQIVQTVAIDIACTGDAETTLVQRALAVDDKAAGARGNVAEHHRPDHGVDAQVQGLRSGALGARRASERAAHDVYGGCRAAVGRWREGGGITAGAASKAAQHAAAHHHVSSGEVARWCTERKAQRRCLVQGQSAVAAGDRHRQRR